MSERTPGKDDVWVEMEVLKGTLVSVYRGRLTGADFEAWRKGELKGAVPLNDTYWSYDEATATRAGW